MFGNWLLVSAYHEAITRDNLPSAASNTLDMIADDVEEKNKQLERERAYVDREPRIFNALGGELEDPSAFEPKSGQ